MTKRGVVRLHNAFFNGELGEYGEIFINQIDSLGEQLGELWGTDGRGFCYL